MGDTVRSLTLTERGRIRTRETLMSQRELDTEQAVSSPDRSAFIRLRSSTLWALHRRGSYLIGGISQSSDGSFLTPLPHSQPLGRFLTSRALKTQSSDTLVCYRPETGAKRTGAFLSTPNNPDNP